MAREVRIAPPNSLLLLMDLRSREFPARMGGAGVAATASCIAIACRSDADGRTRVVLGGRGDVEPSGALVFEGTLATPSRRASLRTVHDQEILGLDVPGDRVRVRIWADDAREPGNVVIAVF